MGDLWLTKIWKLIVSCFECTLSIIIDIEYKLIVMYPV